MTNHTVKADWRHKTLLRWARLIPWPVQLWQLKLALAKWLR